MAEREIRERDILVASNEYAYVQDLTKGDIVLYVGPTKISLSNTERLVEYRDGRFVPARGEETSGVHSFVTASSAQYIILENPPKDATGRAVKGSNSAVELLVGRRVVVPGPATFPLWPGQRAQVVDGHRLREDQYLVVRVYDQVDGDESPIGTEQIVRGSDVSFYLPRTGLEVVPHASGYVRQARRLRKSTGLHLRVIKPFEAAEDEQLPAGRYSAGQDVFLHDREGFFFPTDRLEIVGEVQAMPIAEKEGIHVRDIETGRIATVVGPRSYLPDPTGVEVVSRPVDARTAALYGVRPQAGRALAVYVPPSYAVMVTAQNRREVVKGPQTRILDWDEDLEVLTLSTGRPKSDAELLETCFLQIEGNKVSDVVRLTTADHVSLEVTLSYRVSFITRDGAAERWFNVKNYVGLLCDHLGSILRAAARATPIQAFHSGSTEILRGAVLGEKHGDGKRPGRPFEENDLWVYDVEILDVRILDGEVEKLLADAQRTAIVFEVERRQEGLRLSNEKVKEAVKREIFEAQIESLAAETRRELAQREAALADAETEAELLRLQAQGKARAHAEALALTEAARLEAKAREQALEQDALLGRVAAFEREMAALHPELVSTLQNLGNRHLAGELTRNLGPLSILGGESVAEIAGRLLGALPLGPQGEAASGLVQALPRSRGKKGE